MPETIHEAVLRLQREKGELEESVAKLTAAILHRGAGVTVIELGETTSLLLKGKERIQRLNGVLVLDDYRSEIGIDGVASTSIHLRVIEANRPFGSTAGEESRPLTLKDLDDALDALKSLSPVLWRDQVQGMWP